MNGLRASSSRYNEEEMENIMDIKSENLEYSIDIKEDSTSFSDYHQDIRENYELTNTMIELPTKKRKRNAKATMQQFEIYVNLLESDLHFRENAFKPGEDSSIIQTKWNTLVQDLNSSGGPRKDLKTWKRTFSNWKTSVRSKARKIIASHNETGNSGPSEVALTPVEEKLINIFGAANLPEVGIRGNPIFSNERVVSQEDEDNSDYFDEAEVFQPKLPKVSQQPSVLPNVRETSASTVVQRKNVTLHSVSKELKDSNNKEELLGSIDKKLESLVEIQRQRHELKKLSKELKDLNSKEELLESIDKRLESLVEIQRQRLELEKLRFQLDYPGHTLEKDTEGLKNL